MLVEAEDKDRNRFRETSRSRWWTLLKQDVNNFFESRKHHYEIYLASNLPFTPLNPFGHPLLAG